MASVNNRPDGHRWIQFVDPNGRRQTLRLGKANAKAAADVCRRVETLLAAAMTGTPIDRDTAGWLASLDVRLRRRLSAVALTDTAGDRVRLAEFLDEYVTSRTDLKASTLTVLGHTKRCLLRFFGENKLLRAITAGDAEAWRIWLATEANDRDNERDELSDNTVRRRTGIAKQFFHAALKKQFIDVNPFAGLTAQVRGNRARQKFVTRDEIQKVIDAAPDLEWRTIIALSRYAGLRVPSELLALRWTDVDLPGGQMIIRASKTEHHESGGIRACPIFPELRPYLEAAWDAAEPGAEHVITRYRDSRTNLRTGLLRIIARAGLAPWPKLFHNLRATRQTELLDRFPVKAVCEWLGNSQAVAIEHYAQVTAEHFRVAAVEATGPVEAKQNPKQQVPATACDDQNDSHSGESESQDFPAVAELCENLQLAGMGGTRLELVTSTMSTWRSNQLS